MLSNGQGILLGFLLSGFFAVACLRASKPALTEGKLNLKNLFRLRSRIDRLRRSRWQWFSMVLLMLVLRLQHILPFFLEVMAALQFAVFLALPARADGHAEKESRGDPIVVASH